MTDSFTTAATAEARRESPLYDNEVLSYGVRMAEWARAHLAAQEPTGDEHYANTLHPDEVVALLDALARAEAQSETRRLDMEYWQERAEGFEARIADVLALCDEWAAMGTRSMNIGAVRRALEE